MQVTCGRTDSVQALLRLPALLSGLSARKDWESDGRIVSRVYYGAQC